ncbi:MAG: GNAT family N-acetyltransferase [Roseibium sp.]|uniref:GNAT family N-acetyltransferase n=1 Tax=Roseibium sp. TaxID=1936156 RepID=UPI003D9C35DA
MTKDFSIRQARLSDKEALTELCLRSKQSNGYDDAFMDACVDELRVRESWISDDDFWVAEAPDGSLAGCIRLSSGETDGGELETCFVAPDYKGKGVGRALFQTLERRAKTIGLSHIELDADPFAETFYARMGFTTRGRSPSGSIPGRTLPRMRLELVREPDV